MSGLLEQQAGASLASRRLGEGRRTIWILHGIMGSKKNWTRFARQLAASAPGWCVRVIDLRCHGESAPGVEPHTLSACAEDLLQASELWELPELLVGHSFGGKVALAFGARAAVPPRSIWTLDSPLSAQPERAGAGEIAEVIRACATLSLPLQSRAELVQHFEAAGLASGIGQWMTTNLKRAEDGLRWTFSLSGIQALIDDYFQSDGWALLDRVRRRPVQEITLLYAERGGRSSSAERARAAALPVPVRVCGLEDAGHWVHIDQPEALLRLLLDAIERLPPNAQTLAHRGRG